MTTLEKYNELLSKPQLHVDGLSLKVSKALGFVHIDISVGEMADEKAATGFARFQIFLKPDEIDNLIERLKIAKDALLEQ